MNDMAERIEEQVLVLQQTHPSQRRVARLLALGITPPAIADHLELSEGAVRKWAHDPRTVNLMENLEELAREESLLNKEQFDHIQKLSIKTYEEILANKTLPAETRMRAANQVLDRHPEGRFIKASKHKMETPSAVDGDAIHELKRRAILVTAEVIDTTPQQDGLAPHSPVPPHTGEGTDGVHVHRSECPPLGIENVPRGTGESADE